MKRTVLETDNSEKETTVNRKSEKRKSEKDSSGRKLTEK